MRPVMHTADLNGGLDDTFGDKAGQMIHQLLKINQFLLAEIEMRKLRQLETRAFPGPPHSDSATKEGRSRDRFAEELRNSVLRPLLRAKIYLQLLESQIPPEQTDPGVNELKRLILHGIIQVRAIIWDLSPHATCGLPTDADREPLSLK
jgi:signal transduction histidine kinase